MVPYIIFLIVLTIITSIIAIISAIKSKYNNENYFNKKLSTITAIICFILQVNCLMVMSDSFKHWGYWDVFLTLLPFSFIFYLPVILSILLFALVCFIKQRRKQASKIG
ncbi:MAG TPA: hypothetical protein DDW90_10200 [Cyanobacteria bacterium UBA9971]|nr:hypothetical protein [Cyanobacteria bacterium UBA9971]